MEDLGERKWHCGQSNWHEEGCGSERAHGYGLFRSDCTCAKDCNCAFGRARKAPTNPLYDFKAFKPDSLKRTKEIGTFRDNRMTLLMPSLEGRPSLAAWRAWDAMAWPPNTDKGAMDCPYHEVGDAYNILVKRVLQAEPYNKWQWVLTREEDNIPKPDVVLRLLRAIRTCIDCGKEVVDGELYCPDGHRRLDAVSGLYFMKSNPPLPMAFGEAGSDNVRPIDVTEYIEKSEVVEVNGIAMGCALWRLDMFRSISEPWFKTVANGEAEVDFEIQSDDDVQAIIMDLDDTSVTSTYRSATQDLYFCRKAKEEIGARFAVDCGAHVGHIDMRTGEIT